MVAVTRGPPELVVGAPGDVRPDQRRDSRSHQQRGAARLELQEPLEWPDHQTGDGALGPHPRAPHPAPSSLAGLVLHVARYDRSRKRLGQVPEERLAADDAERAFVADHRHHQYAVVKKDLGQADVREPLLDRYLLGVHVLRDRFLSARRPLLQGFVEFGGNEAGVVQLANVTRKQGRHELALTEEPDQRAVGIHDRERGQPTGHKGRQGTCHGFVGRQRRRVLNRQMRHRYLTAM